MINYMWFSVFICASLSIERPSVTLSLGELEGYYKKSYNGRTYSAFEGIPYAKPPIGNLRFEEAVPGESWLGKWNASTTYACLQTNMMSHAIYGNEDCLYLNVYVPNETPTSADNLDVIFHIHGGAFKVGGPTTGGPKFLMDKNVVYVNINYRLGVFGFLSTEDEVVPGNMGLKDQTLALKWVQKHIKKFGGNPNSVTIHGISAGASAVHLHYFSKNSKGLFHRGISNSGNALMSSSIQRGALERAKQLSALLGCDNSSSRVFINCMKQKSGKQIIENVDLLTYPFSPQFPLSLFGPVVEPKGKNAFLEDYPYNVLENEEFNDVPWMNTVCQKEGILGFKLAGMDGLEIVDEKWDERVHIYLDCNYTLCEDDREFVAKTVKEYYFGNESISNDTIQELISLLGDRYFLNSFEKSSRIQAHNSKSLIYAYIFNYSSSFGYKFFNSPENYGVGHGEDGFLMVDFVFNGRSSDNFNLTETDELIKDVLLNIITSFARNGIPSGLNVEWHPVTLSDDFSYLYIENPDKIEMLTNEEITPTELWDNLPIMENEKENEKCKK